MKNEFTADLNKKHDYDPSLQVAAIIYTTGTTGAPKGGMLTHTNLLFSCAHSARSRLTSSNDVIYAALPISHVYGLTSVALAALWAGASLILLWFVWFRLDGALSRRAVSSTGSQ